MNENDIADVGKIQIKITKKKLPKFWEREMNERLKKNKCLVAESDKKVVGFIIGGIRSWEFGIEKSGWIEILGVEPDYMGRGIGRKLGKAILKIFKDNGIKIVYTAVRWDSGDLLSFFKNLGFERSDFINLERCIE